MLYGQSSQEGSLRKVTRTLARSLSRSLYGSVLALMLFAASRAQNGDDSVIRRVKAARDEADRGNISSAKTELMSVLSAHPELASVWYELGSVLGQGADFRAAEAAFRRAIELDPRLSKAHFGLALSLIGNPGEKQDWTNAIGECREALKYRPDYPEALSLLGAGLANTGQTDEAITTLRRAVRSAPALADAHFNLGLALESNDLLDEAAAEYRSAVEARANYPPATCALGKLLVRQGHIVEAEQQFQAALLANPDLADAHYNLARVLQSLKRTEEARIEFDTARELMDREQNGRRSAELSNQALELASKNGREEATHLLGEAIDLKPDYGIPHFNLGLIYADEGNDAEAIQEFTKAISLMPLQPKVWVNLGRIYSREKDPLRALRAMEWAARLDPNDSSFKFELDSLRQELSGAAPAAESGLSLRTPEVGAVSDTAPAHYEFAMQLNARGDNGGELGELLRCLALDPGMASARRSLALDLERMGRTKLALIEYCKLLRLDPQNGDLHLQIGKLMLKQGATEAALDHLRLAVRYKAPSVQAREALDQALRASKSH